MVYAESDEFDAIDPVDTLPSQPTVGAWFGLVAAAVMGVVAVTTIVAVTHRPATRNADPFALKDVPETIEGHLVTTDFGRQLFMRNCSSCHGHDATGMPNQGANLAKSPFVTRRSDAQLMVFLRTGRNPGDRDTVLGLTMPPRGGNPNLDDAELADIVAYLRLVQQTVAASRHSPVALIGSAKQVASHN